MSQKGFALGSFAMLTRQDVDFARRWDDSRARNIVFTAARVTGMVGAALGMLLVAAFAFGTPEWAAPADLYYLPVFAAFFAVFWFFPRLQRPMRAWSRRIRASSCRRAVALLIRAARQQAPFDAEYDFEDGRLTYVRNKNGTRQAVWQRDLRKYRGRGAAMHAPNVVAIFRRPRSFLPSVVILRDTSDWIMEVLQEAGIATIALSSSEISVSE